jgi:hypothetical protein
MDSHSGSLAPLPRGCASSLGIDGVFLFLFYLAVVHDAEGIVEEALERHMIRCVWPVAKLVRDMHDNHNVACTMHSLLQGYHTDNIVWAMIFTFYSSFLELPLIVSSVLLFLSTLPAFMLAEMRAHMLQAGDSSCPAGYNSLSNALHESKIGLNSNRHAERAYYAEHACITSFARVKWMEHVWPAGDRLLLLALMCATVNVAGQVLLNSRKIIGQADQGWFSSKNCTAFSSTNTSKEAAYGNSGGSNKCKTVSQATNLSWLSPANVQQWTAYQIHSSPAAQLLFEPISMGIYLHSAELGIVENLLSLRAVCHAPLILAVPVVLFDVIM